MDNPYSQPIPQPEMFSEHKNPYAQPIGNWPMVAEPVVEEAEDFGLGKIIPKFPSGPSEPLKVDLPPMLGVGEGQTKPFDFGRWGQAPSETPEATISSYTGEDYGWIDAIGIAGKQFFPTLGNMFGESLGALGSTFKTFSERMIEGNIQMDEWNQYTQHRRPFSREDYQKDSLSTAFDKIGNTLNTESVAIQGMTGGKLSAIHSEIPSKLKKKILENPMNVLDPRWMITNVGAGAVSLLPAIAGFMVGGPIVGGLAGGALEGQAFLANLKQEGMDDGKALLAASTYGILSSVLNATGLEVALGKQTLLQGIKPLIRNVLTGGVVEAGTEWLEQPTAAIIRGIARGDNLETIVNDTVTSMKDLDVIPVSFVLGSGMSMARDTSTSPEEFFASGRERLAEAGDPSWRAQEAEQNKKVSLKAIRKAAKEEQERLAGTDPAAIQQLRAELDSHFNELDKGVPTETFNREQQQARIAEIGIDAFMAEQATVNVPETMPPSGEFFPVEEVGETNPYTEPIPDVVVSELTAASPEAVIEVAADGTHPEYPGWEITVKGKNTALEAQDQIGQYKADFPDALDEDIQVVKIGDQYHMGINYEDAPFIEAEVEIAKTVENLPEPDEFAVIDPEAPTRAELADIQKDPQVDNADLAEQKLFKLIEEINQQGLEASVGAEISQEKDWEGMLAEEGLGVEQVEQVDQMESADPLDEALSWEDIDENMDLVDQMYGEGVELYSGIPINQLRGFTQDISRSAKSRDVDYNPFKSNIAKLGVQYPFNQLGWHELGLQVKIRHEVAELMQDEGLRIAKNLADLQLSPSELGQLSMLREQKVRGDLTVKEKAGLKMLDEVYEKYAERFKSVGGMQLDFPDSLINRNLEILDQLEAKMDKATKADVKAEIYKEIRKLRAENSRLKKLNYSPVMAEWFEKMLEQDPVKVGNIFSAKVLKKRKTISYQDLLDTGNFTLEDFNAHTLMLNYVIRASKTYAMLKVRKAALEDGVMTYNLRAAKKLGYKQVNTSRLPLFKGLHGDARFLEFLDNMAIGHAKGGRVRTFFGTIKGLQFINPTYLGFNNVKQGIMLGSYTSPKLPLHMKKAFLSMKNWDSEFYAAKMNGIGGQPNDNTLRTWADKEFDAQFPMMTRLKRYVFKDLMPRRDNLFGLTSPFLAIRNIYNMSHSAAWEFDIYTRMISYHWLRDQGHSQRSSAQIAALFHGDYASIPKALRERMTMALFTPTYKIAMSKLYGQMMEGAVKTATGKTMPEWEKMEGGGYRYGDSKRRARGMARGLITMMAVTYGFDQFMQRQGWERDKYAWKYSKMVDTPEGKKELVYTENSPFNLLIKIATRVWDATDNADGESPVGKFVRSFRFEVHPVYRVLMFNMMMNKKDDGSPIWYTWDSKMKAQLKSAAYLSRQYVKLLHTLSPDESEAENIETLDREFGRGLSLILRGSAFTYLRAPKAQRAVGKINRLERHVMSDLLSMAKGKEGGKLTKENRDTLKDMFQRLAEEAK